MDWHGIKQNYKHMKIMTTQWLHREQTIGLQKCGYYNE